MRKIVLLGLVLVLAFNLIGCGNSSSDVDFNVDMDIRNVKENDNKDNKKI